MKICTDCKHCQIPDGGNINVAKCLVVRDPFSGSAFMAKIARLDDWQGFALPCGYSGKLWEARP